MQQPQAVAVTRHSSYTVTLPIPNQTCRKCPLKHAQSNALCFVTAQLSSLSSWVYSKSLTACRRTWHVKTPCPGAKLDAYAELPQWMAWLDMLLLTWIHCLGLDTIRWQSKKAWEWWRN